MLFPLKTVAVYLATATSLAAVGAFTSISNGAATDVDPSAGMRAQCAQLLHGASERLRCVEILQQQQALRTRSRYVP
jgi:hypothetical protein